MIRYASVGSNKLAEAKAFYNELLADAGFKPVFEHPSGGRVYREPSGTTFAVLGPFNGEAATIGNGTMVGIEMKSQADVASMHAKALELGGTDAGAPGRRGPEGSPAYFGYFRDLDGNKLCAYNFGGH